MANVHVSGSGNPNLTVGGTSNARISTGNTTMPKYVGARAYVEQTENGATITVIDKDGTTVATISNGADGADGNGITSIEKTDTSGVVDTYTITYSDGTVSTFTVTNGQDGRDGRDGQDGTNGRDGADGQDGFSPTANVVKVGDTATITITDKNGTTTASISDGSSAGAEEIFLATYNSTSYADMLDEYRDGKIIFVRNGSRYVPLYNVGEISGSYIFNFYSLGGGTSKTRYYLSTNGWETATSAEFVTVNRKINNKQLSADITLTATDVGALPSSTSIPSKVSDLTNDSGYITGYTETDPTVPSWAKASSKPSYTFSEIGSTPTSISGYGITDAYTKSEIDGLVSGVLHYKGTKATTSALPSSGNTTGDVWHVTADGSEWAWDGTQWQELGTAVDLSGYVPTSRTVNGKALTSNISLTASDVSALPSSTAIPTITDTYSGTSSDGMSGKAVKSAIDALDGTITGSAGAGKTLTAFSQTDGKVSATFGDISITKSQISDFPTIPTVNNATLTIQKNGTTVNTFTANASSNVTANISVPTKTSDLTNDSGFLTLATLPIYNGGVS